MKIIMVELKIIFSLILVVTFLPIYDVKSEEPEVDYINVIKPILRKNCFSCHKDQNLKGGVDLQTFFFGVDSNEDRIVKGGRVWMKVINQIKSGNMPPDGEPPLSIEERETLIEGINKILFKSLKAENPGRVVIRRLNHKEYQFSILNLVGIEYDTKNNFPADGSGGAGFDNYSRTLFMTPLRLEQYYNAAEEIIDSAYNNVEVWRKLVPEPYIETWLTRIINWVKGLLRGGEFGDESIKSAETIIIPFANHAFRRFINPKEKEDYLTLFKSVYDVNAGKNRFDYAIKEVFKAILVSPKFLYRYEEEQPLETAYPLGSFEMASRLSYFLWSDSPDKELYDVAYRGDLLEPGVLKKQALRMLNDPKSKRFSESFVTQWLGISNLIDNSPLDPLKFPEFTPSLRKSMYDETVEYFHHVISQSKSLKELISSDYTFLNEELSHHYGISGVKGKEFTKLKLKDQVRGGVISMGSVLVSTSLPLRTSPVKRGQFVLEEILGTPAPPPPPDAGELEEDEAAAENASIRDLLVLHRSKPSCMGCHQKMDPIGFGLENFDPVGRWRENYGEKNPIVAWDTLPSGEIFNGPGELKKILVTKDSLFARVISEKMFTYALGRSVEFTDELYIRELMNNLFENEFNSTEFILELIGSYPFRFAVNDKTEKYNVTEN